MKTIGVFEVHSTAELVELASEIIELMKTPCIVLLEGEMGAGKTTLVSTLCNSLGIKENISSPTFSLVNIYNDREGREVYHLDLYRLESADEFLEAGMEDFIHHDFWTFIEWPELAIPFLDSPFKLIRMELTEIGSRKIIIFEN